MAAGGRRHSPHRPQTVRCTPYRASWQWMADDLHQRRGMARVLVNTRRKSGDLASRMVGRRWGTALSKGIPRMNTFDHPLFLSFCLFVGLWLSMRGGAALHRLRKLQPDEQPGFNIILTATLTLLSLIWDSAFRWPSAATISARDTRKPRRTPLVRNIRGPSCCPPQTQPGWKALRTYLAERVSFYETGDRQHLPQIKGETCGFKTNYGQR